jgi:hypothetical protein
MMCMAREEALLEQWKGNCMESHGLNFIEI